MQASILKKAAAIQLLIMDVDGVLTNGTITYNDAGQQAKAFFVPDGLGMKMLLRSGVQIAVISGKQSRATQSRLEELGVKHIYLGYENKTAIFAELTATLQITNAAIAYVGDDIPDIAIMRQVGLSIAVKNAHPKVKAAANLTTKSNGGNGAIREVCELLLRVQNNLRSQENFYA